MGRHNEPWHLRRLASRQRKLDDIDQRRETAINERDEAIADALDDDVERTKMAGALNIKRSRLYEIIERVKEKVADGRINRAA